MAANARRPSDHSAAAIRLERPSPRREREFLHGVERSRDLHAGLVEPPSTTDEYRAYLRRARRPSQESFFVIAEDGDRLVGVVNVNEIVRHSLQSGTLGYYAFVPHAGAGLMREGLALVLERAFRDFALHRLEASIQPANVRSRTLVESLGFRREGLSPKYLKIHGRWRDHERWAILAEEWRQWQAAAPLGASGRRASRVATVSATATESGSPPASASASRASRSASA